VQLSASGTVSYKDVMPAPGTLTSPALDP
jgi:hypothetical protein